MVVVAAPSLIEGKDVSDAAALSLLPWLEEAGTTESTKWLDSRGVARLSLIHI